MMGVLQGPRHVLQARCSWIAALGLAFSFGATTSPMEAPLKASKLRLSNVIAEEVEYRGRKAVRVTASGPDTLGDAARYALIPGVDFRDGSIEVDLAGDTAPNADPAFRGFTGIAFRVDPQAKGYECFYLRPKNGRSQDQLQRNHSTQYISPPEFPWQRLRQETPGMYESYVDLVAGEWTKVRIEVQGVKAKLYVSGATQPVLLVNDLKHGLSHGGVGLWVGPGSISHFSNLRIQPAGH